MDVIAIDLIYTSKLQIDAIQPIGECNIVTKHTYICTYNEYKHDAYRIEYMQSLCYTQ